MSHRVATRSIGGADSGAEDQSCAFSHGVGVVKIGHRIHQVTFVEAPYVARQLSVFSCQAHLGIPQGLYEGFRRGLESMVQGTQNFRQVRSRDA